MGKATGLAMAAGCVMAMGGAAMGQNFVVDSATNDGQGCWGDTKTEAFELSGNCSASFPGNSGSLSASGSGEIGGVPRFSMDAHWDQSGCCSRSFRPRIRSYYNLNDLVISGGSGIVAAECTLDLYAYHDLQWDCSNCDDPPPSPAVPTLTYFRAIFGGTGGNDVVLNAPTNGWHSLTWSASFNASHPAATWNVAIEARFNMDTPIGPDQTSSAVAHAVALLGPVNPDGSIGPVFTFPDCPTCTANAPSIGLVNNYIFPPPGTCVGDLDGDGATTVLDFGDLTANFGQTGLVPGTNGDLDYDGDCDVLDFGMWAGDFGCGT